MLLRVWQLIDSGFPSGGFTHSLGVEAAVHHGDVRTLADVRRVTGIVVRQAGHGALPFVRAAHGHHADLPALDARADLFLNQPVSNRASRAQGLAMLNTAVRVFSSAPLRSIADVVHRERLCGHHSPIFGAVMSSLGIDLDVASRMLLFQSARAAMSAAVRLGVIGTFDGQRVLGDVERDIDEILESCASIDVSDVAQTAPLLDLFQATHDRLYSRLFQS